jgi:TetR/AcrR family transcriptional regulator
MNNEISHDTKERILKAAIDVFIEKGKYGARMQEIADRAEINKAMLHYYFTDKNTLYERSIEYIFTNLFLKIEGFLEKERTSVDKIGRFVDIYIDFLAENVGITRIFAREMADGGYVFKKVMRNLTQKSGFFTPLTLMDIIDNSKESGEIRDVDTVQTIISIVGMSLFYFIGKPVVDTIWNIGPENQDDFIRARKKSIIDLIHHGLKA